MWLTLQQRSQLTALAVLQSSIQEQHGTGGWQNTTMLHNLDITWEGENNQNPEYVEGNPSDNENPAEKPDDSTGTSTGADTTVKTGDMSHTGMYAALTSSKPLWHCLEWQQYT